MADNYEVQVSFGTTVPGRVKPSVPETGPQPQGDEFSDFEALTRKLMNVSKSEVDEARKAES